MSLDQIETVLQPWGLFTTIAMNQPCTVKILHIKPNQMTSMQKHQLRTEYWIPLNNGMSMIKNKVIFLLEENKIYEIPQNTIHRLIGKPNGGRILEISLGAFKEEDIERLEDCYGRN